MDSDDSELCTSKHGIQSTFEDTRHIIHAPCDIKAQNFIRQLRLCGPINFYEDECDRNSFWLNENVAETIAKDITNESVKKRWRNLAT